MTDLDSYISLIAEEEDKILLREASACLEAGARRAAYITIWLATAESLRRRFLEARNFDGQAGAIVGEIEDKESKHRSIDGFLIDKSREYGFVSDAESQRLRHLYENRNVYGHPYEQSPSEEAVVAGAADATEIVLGREVRLRHGFLDRQIIRLTTDTTFLADDNGAIEAFAEQVHRRSAPDLRAWFVRKLVIAIEPVFDDPTRDGLQRRGVVFIRRFLMADESVFDEWDAADDLPDHPTALARILCAPSVFDHISDHARDIVVNVLSENIRADRRSLRAFWRLKEAGRLSTRNEQRFEQRLAALPLSQIVGRGLPLAVIVEKIVKGLETHTWDTQNEAINAIRNFDPADVAQLATQVQEELGRQVMQAAEGRAFAAINFLAEMAVAQPPWPRAFVEGVSIEPFLAQGGEVRFKPDQGAQAIKALLSLTEEERDAVLTRLVEGLIGGDVRDSPLFSEQQKKIVGELGPLSEQTGLERLTEVVEAVESKQSTFEW
jgi:hypothetical protein